MFLKFLETVRANFEKNLAARQIASSLGTTELKLNELSKLHAGRTAQNVIFGLMASEAKRLFIYEKLSVKEVAYELDLMTRFIFPTSLKSKQSNPPKRIKKNTPFKSYMLFPELSIL